MIQYKKARAFMLMMVLALLSFTTSAQSGVATIYKDSVLRNTPGMAEALLSIDSLSKRYNSNIKGEQERFTAKVGTLLQKYDAAEGEPLSQIKQRMSAVDTALLAVYAEEEVLLANKQRMYESLYQQAYKSKVGVLLETVDNVISAYAKANAIDAVIVMEEAVGRFAYLNRSLDITEEVITILNN